MKLTPDIRDTESSPLVMAAGATGASQSQADVVDAAPVTPPSRQISETPKTRRKYGHFYHQFLLTLTKQT